MPVIISEITVAERQKHHRFNLHRADWKAYKSLSPIANDNQEHPLDEMLCQLEYLIKHAALLSIPQTLVRLMRRPLPWWNVQPHDGKIEKPCDDTNEIKQLKIVSLKRARAIASRTQRLAQRIMLARFCQNHK